MDSNDLKKLALLGICSGVLLIGTSSGSLYADQHYGQQNGEEVKTEKSSCKPGSGCGGAGGCPAVDGDDDDDD